MSITLTTLTPRGKSHVGGAPFAVAGQTDDSTGDETLLAAVSGKSHWLKSIHVDFPAGANQWFRINNDNAAVIGPIDLLNTGTTSWYHTFEKPIEFTAAIKIDCEAATSVHVIIEGMTA